MLVILPAGTLEQERAALNNVFSGHSTQQQQLSSDIVAAVSDANSNSHSDTVAQLLVQAVSAEIENVYVVPALQSRTARAEEQERQQQEAAATELRQAVAAVRIFFV